MSTRQRLVQAETRVMTDRVQNPPSSLAGHIHGGTCWNGQSDRPWRYWSEQEQRPGKNLRLSLSRSGRGGCRREEKGHKILGGLQLRDASLTRAGSQSHSQSQSQSQHQRQSQTEHPADSVLAASLCLRDSAGLGLGLSASQPLSLFCLLIVGGGHPPKFQTFQPSQSGL
jgi:hypothetical protein